MSKLRTTNSIISNSISDDCQMLVDDFFAYINGQIDMIKLIDVRDLIAPMPPTDKMIGEALSRCQQAWLHYCSLYKLPGESHRMLKKRIRKKWEGSVGNKHPKN